MDQLLQDLRYTRRMLARSPGFALVAILTLAMGIGATTSIFTAVNAVFFRPLPYPDAGRLVFVWGHRAEPDRQLPVSLPVALNVASHDRVFDRLGVWTSGTDTRFSLPPEASPRTCSTPWSRPISSRFSEPPPNAAVDSRPLTIGWELRASR